MLKIAITGPESTGKSTLAAQLAAHYGVPWVPEYAREYLENLGRPYEESDLEEIARGQLARWSDAAGEKPELLFLDTELLVLKVWPEHAYGRCAPFILEELQRQDVDLYLLLNVDLPWQPDPQREHPHLRNYFYQLYRKELDQMQVRFVEISGAQETRLHHAIEAVDSLLFHKKQHR